MSTFAAREWDLVSQESGNELLKDLLIVVCKWAEEWGFPLSSLSQCLFPLNHLFTESFAVGMIPCWLCTDLSSLLIKLINTINLGTPWMERERHPLWGESDIFGTAWDENERQNQTPTTDLSQGSVPYSTTADDIKNLLELVESSKWYVCRCDCYILRSVNEVDEKLPLLSRLCLSLSLSLCFFCHSYCFQRSSLSWSKNHVLFTSRDKLVLRAEKTERQ
jgi:hypothetical protein